MVIAHNIMAMNAQRQFNIVGKSKRKSTEKLSSGYRINRAADDAAGLAISEKMRRQIRGLTQGVQNTQDGISLLQVADGALSEVHDMLQRINELAVKSANGTNTATDREYIQQEVGQILTEIDRISETTTFNEKKIFDGTYMDYYSSDYYIYASKTEEDEAIYNKMISGNVSQSSSNITMSDGTEISAKAANEIMKMLSCTQMAWTIGENGYSRTNNPTKYSEYLHTMNAYCKSLSSHAYYPKAYEQKMTDEVEVYTNQYLADGKSSSKSNLSWGYAHAINKCAVGGTPTLTSENMIPERALTGMMTMLTAESNSAYYADAESLFINSCENILKNEGITSGKLKDDLNTLMNKGIQHVNRKSNIGDIYRDIFGSRVVLSDAEMKALPRGCWIQSGTEVNDGMYINIEKMDSSILEISGVDVSTEHEAQNTIANVKSALKKVSSIRSNIGAQQNRLEHTVRNENNIIENTTAAESAIRDTDMSDEMVKMSMLNILSDAGISVMSQANQSGQGVLNLIR